jgi:hypothetical protein
LVGGAVGVGEPPDGSGGGAVVVVAGAVVVVVAGAVVVVVGGAVVLVVAGAVVVVVGGFEVFDATVGSPPAANAAKGARATMRSANNVDSTKRRCVRTSTSFPQTSPSYCARRRLHPKP